MCIRDRTQFDKIMSYIEAGKAEGAKCEIGGKRLGETGYYVATFEAAVQHILELDVS